jgi:RNA 2',3'-cyclic 3'-phosphodiesterase
MPTATWRCFVAVPIPEDLRAALAAARDAWMGDPGASGLRWIEPASWHVTLAFLGAVPPEEIGAIGGSVGAVAGRHRTLQVRTGGLGTFPNPRRATVVWYGVEPDPALAALAADLAGSLSLETAGPFRPHLTLARAPRGGTDLRHWVAQCATSTPIGRLAVHHVELMRSHLGAGPASYEVLSRHPLGGTDD